MSRLNKIIILFFFSILFYACNTGQTKEASDQLKAKMKFEDTVYDFGEIHYESDGRCYFNFTNESNEPLIVNVVRTTCGCTRPEWPKEPVQPGETSRIGVTYNTKIKGKFHKSITVYSNAENSPIKLFIKGNVLSN